MHLFLWASASTISWITFFCFCECYKIHELFVISVMCCYKLQRGAQIFAANTADNFEPWDEFGQKWISVFSRKHWCPQFTVILQVSRLREMYRLRFIHTSHRLTDIINFHSLDCFSKNFHLLSKIQDCVLWQETRVYVSACNGPNSKLTKWWSLTKSNLKVS